MPSMESADPGDLSDRTDNRPPGTAIHTDSGPFSFAHKQIIKAMRKQKEINSEI